MRLLSDPLPLRVAADLPRYRTEAAARVLPWVYGRVTLSPVPLDDAGLEWLVADHPVVAVEAVRSAGKALDGWQLVQRLDETGRAIATVRLTRAPEAELAAQVVGRRDDTSGALLEHPAAIAAVFPADGAADRVVLLVTDGEDHEGDPLALLPELKEKHVRVYTIGIGTLAGEMVPAGDGQGYFKDRQGQIVKTALKEDVLQKLALGTGGTYVRSAPGDTGLERVFNESINNLKRSEQETRTAKIYEERFVWAIAAALLLLAWEALLSDRRKNHAEAGA